jgi:hypothetical protein
MIVYNGHNSAGNIDEPVRPRNNQHKISVSSQILVMAFWIQYRDAKYATHKCPYPVTPDGISDQPILRIMGSINWHSYSLLKESPRGFY